MNVGMREVVLGGVGDADRAGDGQNFGYVSGATTAAIFSVDHVANVVVAVFNPPVGTDDFCKDGWYRQRLRSGW